MKSCNKELLNIIYKAKRKNPAKNFIILDEEDLQALIKLGKRMDKIQEKLNEQLYERYYRYGQMSGEEMEKRTDE